MPVGAVLFSEMTPDPSWEDRFNGWYDGEHIPLRMGAPGFLGAQRYRGDAGAGYLAVYDMTAPDALSTPDYTRIKTEPSAETRWMLANVTGFTRYVGSLISWQTQAGVGDEEMLSAPVLFAVMFAVPPDRTDEFDRWYVEEHVPLLLGCTDWLRCRRYRLSVADPEPFILRCTTFSRRRRSTARRGRRRGRRIGADPLRKSLGSRDAMGCFIVTGRASSERPANQPEANPAWTG